MWIYVVLIVIGRVHTYTVDTDPDIVTSNLTPNIEEQTVQTIASTAQPLNPTLNPTDSIVEPIDSSDESASIQVNNGGFPYMAAILHVNEYLLGAGAIVGEKWILVTAFQMGAFKADQLRVRVGSPEALSGGQVLSVKNIFPHPMFNQFNNDVALLKTASTVVLSKTVWVIPMATSSPLMGSQAALLVWNDEARLEKNQADILPVSECRVFYPDFDLTGSNICVVMDKILPYRVWLYGSPLVCNNSLVGLYMGLEANTFKPSLCSNMEPITVWVQTMMTNETDTLRLFPLS